MLLDRRQTLAAAIAAAMPWQLEARTVADTTNYAAVAMQLAARSVERAKSPVEARAQIMAHIGELEGQIRSASVFITQYGGAAVKLAVLRLHPMGLNMKRSAGWRRT